MNVGTITTPKKTDEQLGHTQTLPVSLTRSNSLTKLTLIAAGHLLLYFVAQTIFANALLASITLLAYLCVGAISNSSNRRVLQAIESISVPLAFLAIIVFNVTGLIGTLIGQDTTPSGAYGRAFIAFPFYALSVAALLAEATKARNRKNPASLTDVFLYVCMPFKLLSGPLETPQILAQFSRIRLRMDTATLYLALSWIILGAFMKFVIANQLTPSDMLRLTDAPSALLCAFVFELKFYFDFAGYSFMALGSARFFNIRLIKNFDHPFMARNVVQFWRTWHVSLGAYLSKYMLKPNLRPTAPRKINAIIAASIFLVSAMWHGGTLNYLAWGAFHGVVYYVFTEHFKKAHTARWLGVLTMASFFVLGRLFAIEPQFGRLLDKLANILFLHGSWHLQIEHARALLASNARAIAVASIFLAIEVHQVFIKKRRSYHSFRRPVPLLITTLIILAFGTNTGELLYARF